MSPSKRVLNAPTRALPRLCLLLPLLVVNNARGEPLEIELHILDAPPLTFVNDPRGHGIVGDVAVAAMTKAGYAVKKSIYSPGPGHRNTSVKNMTT
nr:hypothetical protein GCM10020185_72930 [Pseudomonas brassicacearum subsp. brassicacearum]